MPDNWLATLGSWLVKPISVVLAPWWDRLVEQKAESEALRVKVLEAIVRFRVNDYCQRDRSVDSERAAGIAMRITDRLKPIVKGNSSLDLSSQVFLKSVESEIQLHSVNLAVWMELACLAAIATFDPRSAVVVEFTDSKGSQSHGSTVVHSLQQSFPFTKLLNITDHSSAQLSNEATALLKEYCSRNRLPEARYDVRAEVPMAWGLRWTPLSRPKSCHPSLHW